MMGRKDRRKMTTKNVDLIFSYQQVVRMRWDRDCNNDSLLIVDKFGYISSAPYIFLRKMC